MVILVELLQLTQDFYWISLLFNLTEIKGQAAAATLLLEKQTVGGVRQGKHIQGFGLNDEMFKWK